MSGGVLTLNRPARARAGRRIVVTVDMISTGTDVKPIECVFFLSQRFEYG